MFWDLMAAYYVVGLAIASTLFVQARDELTIHLELSTPGGDGISRALILCLALLLAAALWPLLLLNARG